MAKSTISESIPTIALRNQGVPDTPPAERRLGPKPPQRARVEFSRASMAEPWRSGYHDTIRTLRHPEVIERAGNGNEITIFDFTGDRD
jgi:Patatin phospholipase